MPGLQRFERRLEGLVSGLFARAFKGAVEPVELAAALKREVDNTARILTRDRRLVPNQFMIELGTDDYQRLSEYGRTLNHELANELRDHADIQRYTFSGPIDITLTEQPELPVGKFRIHSATAGAAGRSRPEANDGRTQVHAAPPPGRPAPQPQFGPPQVVLELNGRQRPVNPPGVVIGRGTDADIQINDPGVSRRHAEIRLMPEGGDGVRVVLVDLGSTNGTVVNGRRTAEAELRDGSTVRLGTTDLVLRFVPAQQPERPAYQEPYGQRTQPHEPPAHYQAPPERYEPPQQYEPQRYEPPRDQRRYEPPQHEPQRYERQRYEPEPTPYEPEPPQYQPERPRYEPEPTPYEPEPAPYEPDPPSYQRPDQQRPDQRRPDERRPDERRPGRPAHRRPQPPDSWR